MRPDQQRKRRSKAEMKLIERYIFRRASIMFFATLLPLLGIVWVTQALNSVNLVTDSGQSITAFLKLATLILPSVVPIILPFAFVIASSKMTPALGGAAILAVTRPDRPVRPSPPPSRPGFSIPVRYMVMVPNQSAAVCIRPTADAGCERTQPLARRRRLARTLRR